MSPFFDDVNETDEVTMTTALPAVRVSRGDVSLQLGNRSKPSISGRKWIMLVVALAALPGIAVYATRDESPLAPVFVSMGRLVPIAVLGFPFAAKDIDVRDAAIEVEDRLPSMQCLPSTYVYRCHHERKMWRQNEDPGRTSGLGIWRIFLREPSRHRKWPSLKNTLADLRWKSARV
jgi:hypothetical protein